MGSKSTPAVFRKGFQRGQCSPKYFLSPTEKWIAWYSLCELASATDSNISYRFMIFARLSTTSGLSTVNYKISNLDLITSIIIRRELHIIRTQKLHLSERKFCSFHSFHCLLKSLKLSAVHPCFSKVCFSILIAPFITSTKPVTNWCVKFSKWTWALYPADPEWSPCSFYLSLTEFDWWVNFQL